MRFHLLFLGCTVFTQDAISQLKADFSANITNACVPVVVKFTDASSGNPTLWKWDLGNGTISTLQNPSIIYFNSGTYTIKLIVFNASGTDSITKTNYISVNNKPSVDFTANPISGCPPLMVQFTDASTAGSGNLSSWSWDFGDGHTDTVENPLHMYTNGNIFGVVLMVKNNFGCKQTIEKPAFINVLAPVKANFSYAFTNACKTPIVVTFTNTSSPDSSLQYQWNFGDGNTSTQASPVYTYTSNGNYQVQLVATNEKGCADTSIQKISIGTVIPDFTFNNTCINQTVNFKNISSPAPLSVQWSFGDNTSDSTINTSHSYATSGSYQVTMTADFGSCKTSKTKTITIAAKPSASFSAKGSVAQCAVPATVQFNNTTTGATTYQWFFGDSTSAISANPSHTYNTAGYFDITLIASNASGCSDTLTQKKLIDLGPPQITGIQNLPFSGCVGDNIKMTPVIISPETIASYTWDFGDSSTSKDSVPVHSYLSAGSYTITLKVTTTSGCTAVLTSTATVSTVPVAKFIQSPVNACASAPIQFTDQSTGTISSWQWNFGDNTSSSLQNPSHLYTDTGKFAVQLIVSNNGCTNVYKGDSIYIHPPIAKFTVTNQCQFRFIKEFKDSSIGAVSRLWDFGDEQKDTSLNPQHTYSNPGIYTVSLTVTNGSCNSKVTKTVPVVKQTPVFDYSPKNQVFCKYNSVQFKVSNYDPSLDSTLLWDFGDTTNALIHATDSVTSHQYTYPGTFSPVLVVQDILGCKDTVAGIVSFTVYGPHAAFAPNVAGDCLLSNVSFSDKSTTDGIHDIVKWIWDFGDGTIDTLTGSPFKHTYNKADSFSIQLKVIDSYGCMDSVALQKSLIISQPHANFSLSDSSRCAHNNITFTNLSIGGTLSSSWNFGDGDTSAVQYPVYAYAKQGIYTVKLNITDQFGCKDSITKSNIVTISNPVASFNFTDTFATCPPLFIQPLNTSQNYQTGSVLWQFGDGNKSTLVNPVHNYTNGGVYRLSLVVQGYGQCYDSTSKTLILEGPSGILSYPGFAGCQPATITINAVIKNSIYRTWDFGDGTVITNTDSSITHTYTNYGLYYPKLLLSDTSGCLLTVPGADSVRVSGIRAAFGSTQQISCDSSLINFTDSSQVYFDTLSTFSWKFGDNSNISTLQNTGHYYHSSGNYTVVHTVQSQLGCKDSITSLIGLSVHPSPKLVINTVDSACVLSPVQFFARDTAVADSAITSWQWDFGTGGAALVQQPVYSFPSAGSFKVQVAATNIDGCLDIASKTITILPQPKINVGLDTTLCLGQSITMYPTGADSYVWSDSSSLSCGVCTNPIAKPDSTTRYYVTGITLGCKATDSLLVSVKRPFPLTLSPSDSLCMGGSVQLHASGGDSYNWSPSSGLNNSTIANPVAIPSATTTYALVTSDNKNCFSDTGQLTVSVFPLPTFNIIDSNITVMAGNSNTILTSSSPDVVRWEWTPSTWLSCTNCAEPITQPSNNIVYTAKAFTYEGCSVTDQVTITVLCSGANVYIPNTFSPNGNNMNERFYPRGKGLFIIPTFRVFNRDGLVVYEKRSMTPNAALDGWDGTYKEQPAPTGVYVYEVEVMCENNTVFDLKGNVTLIR